MLNILNLAWLNLAWRTPRCTGDESRRARVLRMVVDGYAYLLGYVHRPDLSCRPHAARNT